MASKLRKLQIRITKMELQLERKNIEIITLRRDLAKCVLTSGRDIKDENDN